MPAETPNTRSSSCLIRTLTSAAETPRIGMRGGVMDGILEALAERRAGSKTAEIRETNRFMKYDSLRLRSPALIVLQGCNVVAIKTGVECR